jgi:hypothetical protein
MNGTLEIADRTIDVWGRRIALHMKTAGTGAPLLYLHPAAGLTFDPFLAALSSEFSIFAPRSRARAPAIRTRFTRSRICSTSR